MRMILTFTLCLTVSTNLAVAKEPISQGLPLQIPANYLERQGFVDIGRDEAEGVKMRTPIASRLSMDDEPVSPIDRSRLNAVFDESFLAVLPIGSPIQIGLDPKGHEAWTYPVGTEVAHQVTYREARTGQLTLQELRLIRKLSSGQWAFGIYTQETASATLRLNAEGDGVTPEHRQFTALDRSGTPVRIEFSRMNPGSCIGCHAATSPGRDSDTPIRTTGPCGFVPQNAELRVGWAARYEQQRGEAAFSRSQ
jgi:hypothetical protein